MSNSGILLSKEAIEEIIKANAIEKERGKQKDINFRTTIFSAGKDFRTSTKGQTPTSPSIISFDLKEDGLKNPIVVFNFRLNKEDYDIPELLGFNVYKRIAESKMSSFTTNIANINAFDKVCSGITRRGKFSDSKKAINNINTNLIPKSISDNNLFQIDELNKNIQLSALSNQNIQGNNTSSRNNITNGSNQDSMNMTSKSTEPLNEKFKKINFIDYTKYIQLQNLKQVTSLDQNFIDVSFRDEMVKYGDAYEYYVTTVFKDLSESSRSNTINMTINNMKSISKPKYFSIKQVDTNSVKLSIGIEKKDNIYQATIYRKLKTDLFFTLLTTQGNINDFIEYLDENLLYGREYIYRVFLENIYGMVSEPEHSSIKCTTQNTLPRGMSNVLKHPDFSLINDQNSDFVKINIFPNDSRVSYYDIKRRDLSSSEVQFSVPSREETDFGGNVAWDDFRFFINKKKIPIKQLMLDTISQGKKIDEITVPLQDISEPIEFIDRYVNVGHIYQYRVEGFDLLGNKTSSAIQTIRPTGKKTVRSPINLSFEKVSEYPLLINIKWKNDTIITDKNKDNFSYIIQRRIENEEKREEFPFSDKEIVVDQVKIKSNEQRPFGEPKFLEYNKIYFYRVATIDKETSEISNFSEEIRVDTFLPVSVPTNLVASFDLNFYPFFIKLDWGIEKEKLIPDYFLIQRRLDSLLSTFSVVGKSYMISEFVDTNIKRDNTYIYRVSSVDGIGRMSAFTEIRVVTK